MGRVSRLILACAALLAITAAAVAPAAGESAADRFLHERCLYRSRGPAGPAGNALVVVSVGPLRIVRQGREVHVRNLGARCRGPQATVDNIDEIVIKGGEEGAEIDERRGRLAPGTTAEPSGSEIEIRLYSPRVTLLGTDGDDQVVVSTLRRAEVGINVNAGADGSRPDYDIITNEGLPRAVNVEGSSGDDLIDARRVRRLGDPDMRHRLEIDGDGGNDTVLGSPGDDWRLEDGRGDDLIRGGGGDDQIWFRLGHDMLIGGRGDDEIFYSAEQRFRLTPPPDGSDRLFGGPGRDRLVDDNRRPDLLNCGPGHDEVGREPRDRPAPNCE